MQRIENLTFPSERALYGSRDLWLDRCVFEGEEDGESALKESKDIRLTGCTMKLRYPFWHDVNIRLENCEMTETCRAPVWYTKNAAYASYEEDIKGTIEEGKLADFVLLDKDVFTVDPEEIKTIKVEKTYLGGKEVYSRE